MYEAGSAKYPFEPVCDQWLQQIGVAMDVKEEYFGCYAKEAETFFDGDHNSMWKADYARSSQTGGYLAENAGDVMPMFQMSVNKLFEAVALFGPALYHQNPNVAVTPLLPPEIAPAALGLMEEDPYAMQQFAALQQQMRVDHDTRATHASIRQSYLNWLQQETSKKDFSRDAITEALVHGMSFLWTEMFTPPGGTVSYPRSRYVSEEDIVYDPDADYYEEVRWIARRRRVPVNLVAKEFGLDEKMIKGHYQSYAAQGQTYGSKYEQSTRKKRGSSWDVLEYWEVYSKNGFGDYLKGASRPVDQSVGDSPHSQYDFRAFGQFCYLAVARGIPFPLNMPPVDPQKADPNEDPQQAMAALAQWPIPFWADPLCDGGWPCSRLHFYSKPRCIWPISLFKPAIGELRFVNWCMSFLADKVASSCQTYVACMKEAAAEIQKQINSSDNPAKLVPYRLLTLSGLTGTQKISDVVSFLQAPDFQQHIWTMVSAVLELIDKRTGLTELVYGMSGRQMRSAREADVKEDKISIRPDDMASRVEDWLSHVATKEMQAAQWALTGEDMAPIIGPVAAQVWDQQMVTEEFESVTRSFSYRIEAGSARKPNKMARMDALNQFGQVALPMMQELAGAGQVGPLNAFLRDFCLAVNIDPTPYVVQPPPPPEEQGPSPEEQKLMMEQQKAQLALQAEQQKAMLDMQLKEDDHEQELRHTEETHEQDIEYTEAMNALQMALMRNKATAATRSGNGKPSASRN